MTFKQHLKTLRDLIFDTAFDPDLEGSYATINELADAAGLSWTTVDNLYRGVTKHPRHETIFRLAQAVGFDLSLVAKELVS